MLALVAIPAGLPIDLLNCLSWQITMWARHGDWSFFVVFKAIAIVVYLRGLPSFSLQTVSDVFAVYQHVTATSLHTYIHIRLVECKLCVLCHMPG